METMQSETIEALAKAVCKVQMDLKNVQKNATNPHFKKDYADLSAILDAVREPLSKNGLAVLQTMEPAETGVVIVTTLVHESGQWMRGKLLMKPNKQDPQSYGSVITYGRRYSLAAIVGVAQTDDDGNDASRNGSGASLKADTGNGNGSKPVPDDIPIVGNGEMDSSMEDMRAAIGEYLESKWSGKDKVQLSWIKDVVGRKVGSLDEVTYDELPKVYEAVQALSKAGV